MTASSATRRLLLLEFVIRDPWVYYGRFFPALQGLAARLGIPGRWLCFGGAYALQKDAGGLVRQAFELDAPSLSRLADAIAEVDPTHVILSDALADAQLDAVLGDRPGVKLLLTSDRPDPRGRARTVFQQVAEATAPDPDGLDLDERRWARHSTWAAGRTDWFLDWLGEPTGKGADRGRYLVDAARPVFRAEMANEQAFACKPHVVLMGGLACDHRLDVRDNPCFEGLTLDGGEPGVGCSFCTYYRGPTCDPRRPPVQVAEEQLRAVLEDCGAGGRNTGVFEVHDVRLFLRLHDFAAMLLRLGLAPGTFIFSPRIDRFLAADLDAALPLFAAGGHVLSVYRMGGESLVEVENLRFNKGVTTDQLDRARALWTRLKREHPATFDYDGTLGYITYTPWTTLEELRDGFRAARARGWREDDVWIYTPLELQPGAAITALAVRDGLTVPRFEDPAFLYKITLNNIAADALLPWRFRDARVDAAFRLIIRYFAAALRARFSDGVFDGDDLYAWVREAHAAERPRPATPAAFALAVIAALEADPEQADLRRLTRRALDEAERPPAPPAPPAPSAPDPAADRAWRAITEVVARWLGGAAPGLGLEVVDTDARGVRLVARVDADVYRLALERAGEEPAPCLLREGRVQLSHDPATPVQSPEHLAKLRLLAKGFDRVLERAHARGAGSRP